MNRRALLIACAVWPLRADDAQKVWDLFTQMAADLSDDKPEEFLSAFHPSTPGLETLRADVTGILRQSEVHSSIELLSETGDNVARSVELDWFLQIVEKLDTAAVTRRRERVRCRLIQQKKKWTITSFEPVNFFAPPQ